MIEVRVCRGGTVYNPPECRDTDSNLKWGDEISDELLCTVESALERGRVEIDEAYTDRTQMQITTHSQDFVQPGSIVSVTDGIHSDNGMLDSITLTFARTVDSIIVQSILNVEML